MNRVREFGAGVLAVRASMTGVPRLRSQQSFFFPGVLECDPVTLTFWRDEPSIRAFAYGQGSHRRQLDRHRSEGLADRTSFTRFRVLSSAGTWHGENPASDRARGAERRPAARCIKPVKSRSIAPSRRTCGGRVRRAKSKNVISR